MEIKKVIGPLGILDRIVFRIVPGFCFLVYTCNLIARLDEELRVSPDAWFLNALYFLAIPFFASIVWWIAVPSAFDPSTDKSQEGLKSLLGNAVLFVVSIASLMYWSPPQSYFQYFSNSGVFLYITVFLADVVFMIRSAIREMFAQKDSSRFSLKALSSLALYFFTCLILPALFIGYSFFVDLLERGTSTAIFFSLLISFVIKVFMRYQKQIAHK